MTKSFDIPLSDPDISAAELEAVAAVLRSPRLSHGPQVEQFEQEFAAWLGRRHAVAVASGTLGLLLTLHAYRIGPGHQVVVSPYAWHQIAHAVPLAGATPVFADIDYWSGTLAPDKVEQHIGPATQAIVATNVNGHPAAWGPLRELATRRGLLLIEDSTEAIGSRYQDQPVGSFGDCAIFDFSQPGALVCGEGGMVVTDDADIAARLRMLRNRRLDERFSVVAGASLPWQAGMSELAAALGRMQLTRLNEILTRRKTVERYYFEHVKSFEGIKDPYVAPEVGEIHWFLYQVHLGTRFTRSSRDAIVDDLHTAGVEAVAWCQPLHRQPAYRGRPALFVTEKVADRVLALPLHAHLSEDQVAFIVQTAKDASINVGAGVAIYL
jgi:dTDP-4-amino-4,6-dideoxygalactose transaminase